MTVVIVSVVIVTVVIVTVVIATVVTVIIVTDEMFDGQRFAILAMFSTELCFRAKKIFS